MTSFRRLVIGIAEFVLVVSMIVYTFGFGVAWRSDRWHLFGGS
jgi:hypothetical protein